MHVLNVFVGLPSKQMFWGLYQPQYSICVDVNSILFIDLSQTFQHIAQLVEQINWENFQEPYIEMQDRGDSLFQLKSCT